MASLSNAIVHPRSLRLDPWAIFLWVAAGLILAAFLWVLLDLIGRGLGQVSWSFILNEPENAGRAGGIGPILVSTLLILLVCLATAVPLAIAVAVFLVEMLPQGTRLGRVVQISLDTLAAVPSVVFGLFGNAFFCIALGRGMAETVALVFTSGYVDRMPSSLMDSGRSLSIHVFDLAMNVPGGDANAYGTGVVLVVALLLINGAVLWLARAWRLKTGLAVVTAA
jgi:ABC-type phosphate transport system permease subunit